MSEEIAHKERIKQPPGACLDSAEPEGKALLDWYSSFAELSRHEEAGVDFLITLLTGNSGIVVAAPHGGGIEPGTSEIAQTIAAGEHSFYGFEGLKLSGNGRLHLTSTRFDEPIGLSAIRQAEAVLAIHGCRELRTIIYAGGLDLESRRTITNALHLAGFTVGVHASLGGTDPRNLCNRGNRGAGVQLEISSGLRRLMFEDLSRWGRQKTTPVFHRFVNALREAIPGKC